MFFKFKDYSYIWGNVKGFYSTDTHGIIVETHWGECFIPLKNIAEPSSLIEYVKVTFVGSVVSVEISAGSLILVLEDDYREDYVNRILKVLGTFVKTTEPNGNIRCHVDLNDMAKLWV